MSEGRHREGDVTKKARRTEGRGPLLWKRANRRGNSPHGGRAVGSRRRFEPASPLPCGVRVAVAPNDLNTNQWRGSSCAVPPMNAPWAGRSRAPCADFVVEGTSIKEGSRVRAGGSLSGSLGVAALRCASAQVTLLPAASLSGPQSGCSVLLGIKTRSTSLSIISPFPAAMPQFTSE